MLLMCVRKLRLVMKWCGGGSVVDEKMREGESWGLVGCMNYVELMQAMLRMFKETHLNKIHEKNNKYFSKLGRNII